MRTPLSAAVAILAGLLILLGYFLPESFTALRSLQTLLLGWAVLVAAAAVLVGILNLVFGVHWKRLRAAQNKDYYSPFLILAFLVTAGLGLAYGPGHPQFQQVVLSIQAPVETSLLAVLAISLVFAAFRLFSLRRGLMGWAFILSAVFFVAAGSVVLLGSPTLAPLQALYQLLPAAGARGLLIGMALGSLTAGLRVLVGADRPYSG